MNTALKINLTVKDICDGFVYNELEGKGLFGLSGKLAIQPEYQRNYIYAADGGNVKRHTIDRLDSLTSATAGQRITYRELTA